MSGNRLLAALLVLAALLGLTLFLFNQREAQDAGPAEVSAKLPKLAKDGIDELEVSVPGKTSVKLALQGKAWALSAPLSAAADQSAVEAALQKLSEIEVLGVAATKEENHAKLEVDDAHAVHVVARKAGKTLADLLIGAYRSGNTMLREKGSANVITVKGSIKYAFDKELKDWRDRSIVEAQADKIKEASFQNIHGSFRFVQEAGVWKQAPGEKAIPSFDPEQVKSIVGSASSMQASDFASAAPSPEAPAGEVKLVVAADGGDQTIVLHVGPKQGDTGYQLTREGQEPVYVVSSFVGDRLLPSADKFAPPKAAPAAATGGAAAAAPGAKPAKVAKPAKTPAAAATP